MSSIDKRIVQMQFDNQNFESGVSKTMSSLKKLNESLKMKGSSEGLDSVNKGISKLSANGMSGLSSGVETVTAKFSALGVIGMTALANITNSAINAGKNLVKSLTVDPIMTGFSEYETKMGSIQTILANTAHHGTTLEDVNKALGDLNTYSDKTIYNFAEMAKNIGTFTAAGIDLDTSTAAIKGIANLAAVSGSTSQQASTAMYQLSQALAAGRVSLADWNSVVNAGMGGKLFQDALIRTSEHLGTGAENMIKKYGSFRESLTKGEWMTTEVLTETLKQLSGAYTEADLIAQGYTKSQAKEIMELAKTGEAAATEVKTFTQLMDTMKESVQSGWAQSWEYIIGDKEQATKLLTSISEGFERIIKPSTDARNEMLKFWNENGGRDDVIKGFTNIFQSLGKGFKSIGEAWKEVFPPMTGKKLTELSEKFKDFTENFKMSDETAGKLKNTFKGIFTVFDTVKDAVVGVVKGFIPLLGMVKPIASGFLTMTSNIGSFVNKIGDAANRSKIFEKIGNGIKSAFEAVGTALSTAGDKVSEFISKMNVGNVFDTIGKVFSKVGEVISKVASGIGQAIGSINFETITNIGKTLVGVGIFKVLKDLFDKFKGIGDDLTGVFDSFKGIGEGISGILDSVKESLTAYQNSLNAATLTKLAVAIGILAASLLVLSTIDPASLATALVGMAGLFAELSLAMNAINEMGDIKGLIKTSASMILMATAMLIMAGALKTLSSISIGEMVTGLLGLATALGTMVLAVKLFNKETKDLTKTSLGLIVFGAALHVMASALERLGGIDAEIMGGGLIVLGGLLAELALFLRAAKLGGLNMGSATGLLLISAAMVVLSEALKRLGSIQWEEIARGLSVMAGALAIIAVAMDAMSELELASMGAGLAIVSAAMLILSVALKSLGDIQWEEIARGLTAMAGALAIIGVATDAMSELEMVTMAVGVAAMGVSLLILSSALRQMGGMTWEEIGKGLLVLAGSLLILGVAMAGMTEGIAGAAAMLVMAAALAILTPQLVALGEMSLAQIGKSLLMLAGALIVLGVAGAALGVVSPLLALAGIALGIFGAACIVAGTGISILATGLTLIATTLGVSGAIILDFIKQMIQQLPQLGLKAAEGFANFMGALSTSIPQITAGFTAILTAILNTIGTMIPAIAQTAVDIVLAFAQTLSEGIPQLVTYGLEMVLGILQGIRDNIYQIVDAAIDTVTAFINAVSDNLGDVIDAGIDLALDFIEGIADGISNNKDRLEAAVEKAINAMIDAAIAVITGAFNSFTKYGGDLLRSFCNGIKNKYNDVKTAVTGAIDRAKQACSRCGTALVQAGRSLIDGLKQGIQQKAKAIYDAASSVVTKAINAAKSALKINSPSKVFIEIGRYTTEGFAVGLDKYARNATKSATNLANSVIDNVKNPLSNIGRIIDGEIDANPTITPVLDLSNVERNSRRIGDLVSGNGTLSLSTDSASFMTKSIGQIQNGPDNSDIVSALKDLKASMADNRPSYTVNGITYDDGSNITSAVETLVRAAKIERRI